MSIELIRSCPVCDTPIRYKSKRGYSDALISESKCRSCVCKTLKRVQTRQVKNTKHMTNGVVNPRICGVCDGIIIYKSTRKRMIAEKNGSPCRSCACKLRERVKHKNKRVEFDIIEGDVLYYKICKLCSDKVHYKNLTHRNSLKDKVCRQCHVLSIKYIFPNYNKVACGVFDSINEHFGINGKHALNDGEHRVGKYFVDFYEPDLNLVIEWNENKIHRYTSEADYNRQRFIQRKLGCEFYTIDDITYNQTKTYEFIQNVIKTTSR